ncbi:hypothetical protein ABB30_11355 [Stenotrophomonas ginsengisoli]|uniref:Lipoprotein n=2 Tax=Stenotrophomonas ginsengisoli TaxID=336566 RepID=A0A0R0DCR7_9GAMM|nr:hypothetical protein ABB30_11355 [Stenotrophomonas ginsengisoli]
MINMLRNTLFTLLLGTTLAACASSGSEKATLTLDASNAATAEASYKQMQRSLPQAKQVELAMAVMAINFIGVNSAYEVVNNPELQQPGVARIKDRIAGMSAEQIIAYAASNSTTKVEVVSP